MVTAMTLAGLPTTGGAQTIYFTENFDNSNFALRGWYDGDGGVIDSSVYSPSGGNSSLKFSFAQGQNSPTGGSPKRHLFTPSESLYVSFWLKLGTASVPWQGSGVSYHPHIVYILTEANGDYDGLAWNYLDFYIEWNGFRPRIAIQDGQRINLGQLGNNLLGTATPHAVAGGNGSQNGSADYYAIGGGDYTNGTYFDSASNNFVNNTWHHVEVYTAMNSISGGLPQANGIVRFWVDGVLVIDRTNVYLRTAQYATQKFNQFVIAPWIEPGTGSPIAQDMWVDNLIVADRPSASPIRLPPPTNLRVVP
jgi:hypothetical protein